MGNSIKAGRQKRPVEARVGRAAETAVNRYWDARGWSDDGPDGACQRCEFLRHDSDTETDDGWWCVLRSGIGTEKDCHLCPGLKTPNAQVKRQAREAGLSA